MTTLLPQLSWRQAAIPLVLVAVFVLGVWLAPDEAMLGDSIKTVYIHVALIWTGMLFLGLAGAAGVVVALLDSAPLARPMRLMAHTGAVFFAAGTVASVVAQQATWGGIFWAEPRNRAVLQIIALTVIIVALHAWPIPRRLSGVLFTGLAIFMFWALQAAPLMMHPRDPISPSDSSGIRVAFFGLTALCVAGAVWLTAIRWRGAPDAP